MVLPAASIEDGKRYQQHSLREKDPSPSRSSDMEVPAASNAAVEVCRKHPLQNTDRPPSSDMELLAASTVDAPIGPQQSVIRHWLKDLLDIVSFNFSLDLVYFCISCSHGPYRASQFMERGDHFGHDRLQVHNHQRCESVLGKDMEDHGVSIDLVQLYIPPMASRDAPFLFLHNTFGFATPITAPSMVCIHCCTQLLYARDRGLLSQSRFCCLNCKIQYETEIQKSMRSNGDETGSPRKDDKVRPLISSLPFLPLGPGFFLYEHLPDQYRELDSNCRGNDSRQHNCCKASSESSPHNSDTTYVREQSTVDNFASTLIEFPEDDGYEELAEEIEQCRLRALLDEGHDLVSLPPRKRNWAPHTSLPDLTRCEELIATSPKASSESSDSTNVQEQLAEEVAQTRLRLLPALSNSEFLVTKRRRLSSNFEATTIEVEAPECKAIQPVQDIITETLSLNTTGAVDGSCACWPEKQIITTRSSPGIAGELPIGVPFEVEEELVLPPRSSSKQKVTADMLKQAAAVLHSLRSEFENCHGRITWSTINYQHLINSDEQLQAPLHPALPSLFYGLDHDQLAFESPS